MSEASVDSGPGPEPGPDGRRARRDRNRAAVIDALFSLLEEEHFPPSVDDVARRAQVSVSSVFLYFDSLDDLHRETIDRYFERFAPLFELAPAVDEGLDERIDILVGSRLRLYEAIAPIARMARVRAADQPRIRASLADTRRRLADQLRIHFAPELRGVDRRAGDELIALVDTLTAFEAWDHLRTAHGESSRSIRGIWTRGLHALFA